MLTFGTMRTPYITDSTFDGDFQLILPLILLLMNDRGDSGLIFALFYILL